MRGVMIAVITAVVSCGDPGGNQGHDAPGMPHDGSPDAPPDAPGIDPPACVSSIVGPGLRASIAHAAGHYAIAYLAVGPALAVAQFTDAGAPAGTGTAAMPMLSAVPPAIAGRDTFLVAYLVPDGSIGLAALAPGGALSAPKTIAASQVADLRLAASQVAGEFALTYTINDSTARFARVAADGTVLAGPVDLPTVVDERVLAISHRSVGGWALVARRAQPASLNLYFVNDNGASPIGIPEVMPQPPTLPGGFVTVGDNYALTLWQPFDLRLFNLNSQGVDDGNQIQIAPAVAFPGNLAADPTGFTFAFADLAGAVHMGHVGPTGLVDDDDVLGNDVNELDSPSAAVAATGSRAAAWTDKTPQVHFSLCP